MVEAVFPIRSGGYCAEVVSVGAGLRKLERAVGGRPWALTETWPADSAPPLSAGLVLAPWPNRIYNGRFEFFGVEHQLEITEPARHNAIHGLVRKREWTIEEHVEHRVVQSIEVGLQQGWPYPLRLTVTHEVGPNGLTVTNTTRNIGSVPAPYGLGFHIFVPLRRHSAGQLLVAIARGRAAATRPRLSGADRVVPTGRGHRIRLHPSPATQRRHARHPIQRAGERPRRPGARSAAAARGPATVLWMEPRFRWLQVFTADPAHGRAYPGRGRALAIEPMTCPPDAFNSSIDVIVLDPGQEWSAEWGMSCG